MPKARPIFMLVSEHILRFYNQLEGDWKLPKGIDLIFPFEDELIQSFMDQFYSKYYSDKKNRTFLFGINPGRLGAGITGIPFTDPVFLESNCKIKNALPRKHELSSIFMYEMIAALGGPLKFYRKYYISSVCPLGFTKEGKNYNYYDDDKLFKAVYDHITQAVNYQTSQFCNKEVAYSIGKGQNFKFFKHLNEKYKWFDEIIPLPHPRWVMQYKLKSKAIYIDEYVSKLS